VAKGGLSPTTRVAVWASVFLAGLVLAVVSPIERGESQTVDPGLAQPEPTPTPDPLPDPNPAQPTVGESPRSSGGSSGGSSVGSSGSVDTSSAGADGGRATVASNQAHRSRSNLQRRETTRAATGAKQGRERRASWRGPRPDLIMGGGGAPTLFDLEVLLLIFAGALALLLTLTVAVPWNGLAGLSVTLAPPRGQAAALLAVLLCAVLVGLLLLLAGQPPAETTPFP
jgi:hypothetical protein